MELGRLELVVDDDPPIGGRSLACTLELATGVAGGGMPVATGALLRVVGEHPATSAAAITSPANVPVRLIITLISISSPVEAAPPGKFLQNQRAAPAALPCPRPRYGINPARTQVPYPCGQTRLFGIISFRPTNVAVMGRVSDTDPNRQPGPEIPNMYATTKSVWLAVISSFWFVPGLISGAALVLAGSLVWLDLSGVTGTLTDASYYPRFGPEGARAILGAIAGGMMTMASLVFSLTFVGLTLVSGQLGPRVFMLFMNDRINQVVLGAFVGIFLFSLIAMANVTELAEGFVPHLAVAMAIASATGAFALVIFFVHHMARSIQADVVVSNLGARFEKAVTRVTEAARQNKNTLHTDAEADLETITGVPIPAAKSGYVGHIDYTSLLDKAEKSALRLKILVRPDDHVIAGLPLARVEGADPDVKALAAGFRIGPRRELLQEATYEARALVDIALRALSSGINDPNTAVAAIDHLSAGLVSLMRADPPQRVLVGHARDCQDRAPRSRDRPLSRSGRPRARSCPAKRYTGDRAPRGSADDAGPRRAPGE